MGRYASFNTGFEYKFVFGLQPSDDITNFGGEVNDTDDEEYNLYYSGHIWNNNDKNTIMSILKDFGEGFVVPDFSKYQNDVEGTYVMYYELIEQISTDHNRVEFFKFVLGCLIYHQLLYTSQLSVQYEV